LRAECIRYSFFGVYLFKEVALGDVDCFFLRAGVTTVILYDRYEGGVQCTINVFAKAAGFMFDNHGFKMSQTHGLGLRHHHQETRYYM